jgi:hypothetical protein
MSRPRALRGSAVFDPQKSMQKILDTIYLHRGEKYCSIERYTNGRDRLVSRLFQELPDKKVYSDYYLVITNPIALDNIQVCSVCAVF